MCQRKNIEFCLGSVTHPTYSPDLVPSDYHLFRLLSNYMRGVMFENEDGLKSYLQNTKTKFKFEIKFEF